MEQNTRDGGPRPVSWLVMGAYFFAQFAAWLALMTPVVITIALRINQLSDAQHKAAWMGMILGIGAACSMLAAPVWGAISDRTTARIGRRKLWIVLGSLSLMSGLMIMGLAEQPLILGIGWVVCQIGSTAAQAALNAVMSDIIPDRQRGTMSALLGASMTGSIVVGVFITQFTQTSPFASFIVPWLASPLAVALFMAIVPDAPAPPQEATPGWSPIAFIRNLWVNPVAHPDFAWAFVGRMLVVFAVMISMTYQVYYLTDHLHIPPAKVAWFMGLSTSVMGIMSVLVTFAGGWLSDRFARRKPFVIGAAIMISTGLVWAALADSFGEFLVAAALISIGQGLFYAVDLALCVSVLPDPDDAAKDLALLQIANSLPQVVAPMVAPLLLMIGGIAGANYFALFAAAGVAALMGAMAIMPIRRTR